MFSLHQLLFLVLLVAILSEVIDLEFAILDADVLVDVVEDAQFLLVGVPLLEYELGEIEIPDEPLCEIAEVEFDLVLP